jgi:hypothetical protein
MSKYDNLVTNAAGRTVPTVINGKPAVPYMGVGKFKPEGGGPGTERGPRQSRSPRWNDHFNPPPFPQR